MGDLNYRNVGEKRGEAVFAELFLSKRRVFNDKTEKTKLCGVSKAERENVYVVLLEYVKHL